jgi:hypothetical protein
MAATLTHAMNTERTNSGVECATNRQLSIERARADAYEMARLQPTGVETKTYPINELTGYKAYKRWDATTGNTMTDALYRLDHLQTLLAYINHRGFRWQCDKYPTKAHYTESVHEELEHVRSNLAHDHPQCWDVQRGINETRRMAGPRHYGLLAGLRR